MKAEVEKEIQRILPLIPTEPPKDTVDKLIRRGYLREERLVYSIDHGFSVAKGKNAKMVRVKCSRCGGEALLEHVGCDNACWRGGSTYGFIEPASGAEVTNGNSCVCPVCGHGMKALYKGSFKSIYEMDSRICMSVHNVEGHLCLLSWVVRKNLHNDGHVSYTVLLYEGVCVIGKSLVRIKGYTKFMTSYSWLNHWEYNKRYSDEFGHFAHDEIIEAKVRTVDATECEKSGIAQYLAGYGELMPSKYLKLWLKHPNVENLARQGCAKYLSSVMGEATGYQGSYYYYTFDVGRTDEYIDWSKVRPHEMLRIDKQEMPLVRELDFKEFTFYREIKELLGIKLTQEDVKRARVFGLYNVKELVSRKIHGYRVPILRAINYLERQRDGAGEHKSLITVSYLRDYWNSLHSVYRAMPPELIWPRDLRRAHDEMLLRVKEKENAEINRKICERLPSLEGYCFTDTESGLFIRPAASHAELIKEGKLLSHCVGGYASAHAEGRTCILFIRHIDEPDIPFFTLEYKNGTVLQNRGYKNCERTPEVRAFEAAWLKYINSEKGNVKNGKREDARIGA